MSGLVSLKELFLNGNSIAELGPLADLESLTDLDLWGNRVVDAGPLADLDALTWLVLGETGSRTWSHCRDCWSWNTWISPTAT